MNQPTKLSTPQFVLLTDLTQIPDRDTVTLSGKGAGWAKAAPLHFRTDVATALVNRALAERTWVNGCCYMKITPKGTARWNAINAALRAKGGHHA